MGISFMDGDIPKDVRREILEASVRAPQDWHQEAVRMAYSSDDESWRLTAVFCMCYIRGFERCRLLTSHPKFPLPDLSQPPQDLLRGEGC